VFNRAKTRVKEDDDSCLERTSERTGEGTGSDERDPYRLSIRYTKREHEMKVNESKPTRGRERERTTTTSNKESARVTERRRTRWSNKAEVLVWRRSVCTRKRR
jgi:hypothetical protein